MNNSTVNNATAAIQASALQTMAGICAGDASAGDNEQDSSLARTSVESSLVNILTNNNDTNANASTRNDKVAFEITTTDETVSRNTDNVSQTEESNLNSTRLFPSNLRGEWTTLLQTQNFDGTIRSHLDILINSINSINAKVGHTSKLNRNKVVNIHGDFNSTELPSTNNTPVDGDNGSNPSKKDDQNNGGASETSDVNENRHVE
jgi:hypothetical protein